MIGEIERDLQLTEVGAPGGQKQRAWVDPASPGYVQNVGTPYGTPTERRIVNDVNKNPRYEDTGKLVYDVEKEVSPEDQDKTLGREEKLRKEYTKVTGKYGAINDAYGRILASLEDPSAAGDLALIFNYMKMLDPGSTVREGEFATAQNAGGVAPRIRARWNSIVSGEKLSTVQRDDFADRSKRLYSEASRNYQKRKGSFRRIAKGAGVNPENVVFERQLYEISGKKQKETSSTGAIQRGERVGEYIVEDLGP